MTTELTPHEALLAVMLRVVSADMDDDNCAKTARELIEQSKPRIKAALGHGSEGAKAGDAFAETDGTMRIRHLEREARIKSLESQLAAEKQRAEKAEAEVVRYKMSVKANYDNELAWRTLELKRHDVTRSQLAAAESKLAAMEKDIEYRKKAEASIGNELLKSGQECAKLREDLAEANRRLTNGALWQVERERDTAKREAQTWKNQAHASNANADSRQIELDAARAELERVKADIENAATHYHGRSIRGESRSIALESELSALKAKLARIAEEAK